MGPLPVAGTDRAALVLLACCGAHLAGVRTYLSQHDDGLVAPIDALPSILGQLGQDGGVFVPQTGAAATA